MNASSNYWIATLGLATHPEGGYFAETYRAAEQLPATGLPARYGAPRSISTAIYFLIEGRQCSRFHRLRSDEIWHFYAGSPVTVHLIDAAGELRSVVMGQDPSAGQTFQAVIPAGTWFGATVDDPASFTLVGCTVAPGFDFADFELATRDGLLAQFPQHREVIERLT